MCCKRPCDGCHHLLLLHFHEVNIKCLLIFKVIEQLPVELRDRFTDMREMDLQVQSESWLGKHFYFIKPFNVLK